MPQSKSIKTMDPYIWEECYPPSNFRRRCFFCGRSAIRRPGEDWKFRHADDCIWWNSQSAERKASGE